MKSALTVALLILITIGSLSALYVQKAKADIQDVQVVSYSHYLVPGYDISGGDFIVVGEVINYGSSTVDPVYVNCLVLTSDGQAKAGGENYIFARYLAPGQKAPFYIDITANESYTGEMGWAQLSDLQVACFVSQANNTDTRQYSSFDIIGEYSSTIDGVFTINGEIKNVGDQTAGPFRLITTFYNDTGTVVAVNVTETLGSTLNPGQSVPFKSTPADKTLIKEQITSYSLLVQTDWPLTGPATPTPTPADSPNTSQSPGVTATPTPNPPQTSPVLYIVVAAVAVTAVVMVVLLLTQKKKPGTSSQDSPPTTEN